MTDPLAEPDDATPLTEEERNSLLLPLFNRKELNRVEAENISRARSWLLFSRRRLRPESVADERWLKDLHRRMYAEVWAWAGEYRTTEKNLGVAHWQIRIDMRDLEADVQAWLGDSSTAAYEDDELAIRFGYRLVAIHPFPNGNGRWSRLASDALIVALGGKPFTWGGGLLIDPGALRRSYISALQTADANQDFAPLVSFARSGSNWRAPHNVESLGVIPPESSRLMTTPRAGRAAPASGRPGGSPPRRARCVVTIGS